MKQLILLWGVLAQLMGAGQMWPDPGPGSAPTHIAAPVTQVIAAGSQSNLSGTASMFAYPAAAVAVITATEADTQAIVLSGTISSLHVVLSGDVGAGGTSATFTLNKNGSPTAVVCVVTGGAGTETTCTSSALSDTVADGDYLTLSIVTVGASAVTPSWTWKWVGNTGDESMLIAHYNAGSTSGITCASFAGTPGAQGAGACASTAVQMIFPEAFTVTKFFARSAADLGADNATRVLTVRKNTSSADTSMQVTLSGVAGSGLSGSDTSGSLSFAANDRIDVEDVMSNTPGVGFVSYTAALSSLDQRFMAGTCGVTSASSSAVNYARPTGTQSWSATESLRQIPTLGFTQTGIGVRYVTAPASGKSYAIALREAAVDQLTCTVADANTTCTATGSASVAADALIDWASTPAGTPTAHADYCLTYTGSGT